jgi:G3E family GTPase
MNLIPLTIIGGYLGAGKTTLLNHILRNSEGRRLAVIVNDFGSINIDANLIESQEGETINLSNGCICCSMVDGFTTALLSIRELCPRPDHIIVEASGVADPYKLGQYGHLPGFQLDGIIVLADAELVRQKARDKYVGETVLQQLRGADVIVLNKTDLVDGKTRKDIHSWLGEVVPDARVVETVLGVAPFPLLLGIDAKSDRSFKLDKNHDHHHDQDYDSWSYTSESPLDGDTFREMVAFLPEGILRAKGILYLSENSEKKHIFQLVGKRWSIEAGEDWADEQPRSKLVLIGLPKSFDPEQLEEKLVLMTR